MAQLFTALDIETLLDTMPSALFDKLKGVGSITRRFKGGGKWRPLGVDFSVPEFRRRLA